MEKYLLQTNCYVVLSQLISRMNSAGGLIYGIILPNYMRIIMSQYKDPYKPTSIMECHKGFFHAAHIFPWRTHHRPMVCCGISLALLGILGFFTSYRSHLRKFQQTPGTYRRYPKIQMKGIRIWGMFQGNVVVFLNTNTYILV